MTPREAIFYGEYIKDGNATRAARAAGSPEGSAHVAGARMLKRPKIAAAITAWKAKQKERFEITAERVIDELAKLATFDPGNLYDREGNPIPVHKLDDFTRAAVAAVDDETTKTSVATGNGEAMKVTETTVRRQRVKMADKGPNLERLGKYFKLFGDGGFGATVEMPGGLPADSTIRIVLVRPE